MEMQAFPLLSLSNDKIAIAGLFLPKTLFLQFLSEVLTNLTFNIILVNKTRAEQAVGWSKSKKRAVWHILSAR